MSKIKKSVGRVQSGRMRGSWDTYFWERHVGALGRAANRGGTRGCIKPEGFWDAGDERSQYQPGSGRGRVGWEAVSILITTLKVRCSSSLSSAGHCMICGWVSPTWRTRDKADKKKNKKCIFSLLCVESSTVSNWGHKSKSHNEVRRRGGGGLTPALKQWLDWRNERYYLSWTSLCSPLPSPSWLLSSSLYIKSSADISLSCLILIDLVHIQARHGPQVLTWQFLVRFSLRIFGF